MPEATVDDRPRTLHQALVKFQAAAPKITKDAKAKVPTKGGGEFSYDYVTLTHLSEEVLPVLAGLGLTWITKPSIHDGRPALTYELAFEDPLPLFEVDGEKVTKRTGREVLEGTMPLMVQSGGPQDLGGAITYMRRYSLCAVLGLAPDTDDDAAQAQEAAKGTKKAPKSLAKATAARVNEAGLMDRLQLAASHVVGDDVGEIGTLDVAIETLSKMTEGQVLAVGRWVDKKVAEAQESSNE